MGGSTINELAETFLVVVPTGTELTKHANAAYAPRFILVNKHRKLAVTLSAKGKLAFPAVRKG